jgi:hypothetical protein
MGDWSIGYPALSTLIGYPALSTLIDEKIDYQQLMKD